MGLQSFYFKHNFKRQETCYGANMLLRHIYRGMQWLSGRVFGMGFNGHWVKTHRRQCVDMEISQHDRNCSS